MRLITKNKNKYVLRFDEGEKWPEAFLKFSKKIKIRGGWFSGFGAVKNPMLAYYDHAKDKYLTKKFSGIFEVVSLVGNISETERDFIVHNHAVLGDKRYEVSGGHLVSAEIGATLEVFLVKTSRLRRDTDSSGLGVLL